MKDSHFALLIMMLQLFANFSNALTLRVEQATSVDFQKCLKTYASSFSLMFRHEPPQRLHDRGMQIQFFGVIERSDFKSCSHLRAVEMHLSWLCPMQSKFMQVSIQLTYRSLLREWKHE